ncbi:hypothetical protein ACLQ28_01590 [Micromonospora sp. DT201]|uniref:hypothetical protein n=1 Tax=Micromonospora sp. DT201 TaxID=3393442 RepID=UPI003CEB478B
MLYDGRTIKAEGNSNQAYFNDPAVNAEIDRILALEPAAQGPEWAKRRCVCAFRCVGVPSVAA